MTEISARAVFTGPVGGKAAKTSWSPLWAFVGERINLCDCGIK